MIIAYALPVFNTILVHLIHNSLACYVHNAQYLENILSKLNIQISIVMYSKVIPFD